jgi:hypothetical protein
VRFRHANAFTRRTELAVVLPAGNLRVGEYVANGSPALSEVAPLEGSGSFSAIADAIFFTRSAPTVVAPPASGGTTHFAGASLAANPPVGVPGPNSRERDACTRAAVRRRACALQSGACPLSSNG